MRKLTLAAFVSVALVSVTAIAQSMDVPEAVRVPAGQKMTMKAIGVGELTYECRAKPSDPAAFEWAFAGPVAKLVDSTSNKEIGTYYAGPTWEAADGSKVTGKQVGTAPAAAGSIPLQLVKTEPATVQGVMSGVTYIQRINTQGGVAPADGCTASTVGARKQVPYRAEYVFYSM